MKPILILQLRELDEAADGEFMAFLKYGNLHESEVKRVRMERQSIANLNPLDYSGIIVGGGPSNVSDNEETKPSFQRRFEGELKELYRQVCEFDIPYLGSCYGLGSIIQYCGGIVSKENYSEDVGGTTIHINETGMADPLLIGLDNTFTALCGHKEACQSLPENAMLLASSANCPVQIIRIKTNIYATQFHCELDADGVIERIHFYKHHGYFEPDAANELIEKIKGFKVETPARILQRFIERYRG